MPIDSTTLQTDPVADPGQGVVINHPSEGTISEDTPMAVVDNVESATGAPVAADAPVAVVNDAENAEI